MTISENILRVQDKISSAAHRANRASNEVQLIAVSKTMPLEFIRQAFQAGQKSFGENYAQEAVSKASEFSAPEWHFIGGLQTNKAKMLGGRFSLIHSVDRVNLASEINRLAERENKIQDVLIQVHLGDEVTKQGVRFEDLGGLVEHFQLCPWLRLRGLMSLPPLSNDEKVSRGYFSSLRDQLSRMSSASPASQRDHCNVLSMGTSGDFEWAILEGATHVRVGTAIFGSRN